MENPPEPLAVTRRGPLIPFQWKPQALTAPVIDPELHQMDGLQRAGEVLRYSVGKLEFWISPGGRLREWLRFNVTVAVFIGIPALLIAPLITFLIGQIAACSASVSQIAANLTIIPVSLLLLTAALVVIRIVLRS